MNESRVLLVAAALACPLMLTGTVLTGTVLAETGGSAAGKIVAGAYSGNAISGAPACRWNTSAIRDSNPSDDFRMSIAGLTGPANADTKPTGNARRGNPVSCDHHGMVTGSAIESKAGQVIRICDC